MKALVLYYSRTGNTKLIAEAVADALQADLEPLMDPQDYSGVLGYLRAGKAAMTGRAASIGKLNHDPAQYDLIVLGQPVWGGRPVPAIRGLSQAHPLNGKSVALFVTLDGAGDSGCLERTTALLPGARIIAKTSFFRVGRNQEDATAKAKAWAKSLRL